MAVKLPHLNAARADGCSGIAGMPHHGLLSVRWLNPRTRYHKMRPVHVRLEKPPMLIFKRNRREKSPTQTPVRASTRMRPRCRLRSVPLDRNGLRSERIPESNGPADWELTGLPYPQ